MEQKEENFLSFDFLRGLFSLQENRETSSKKDKKRHSSTKSPPNIGLDISELEYQPGTRNIFGQSYVAGFMDFDPKFAARNAYRVNTNRGAVKRGESSWFNT